MSTVNWRSETKSVSEIISDLMPLVDNDPSWQRGRIHPSDIGGSTPSKSQGIINSALMGYDLGEVTLVRTEKGSASPFETLDGAHRMRAIRDFCANKFPTHKSLPYGGKFFKNLEPEQRKAIMSFMIRIVIYEGLSNEAKGLMFRLRNGGTPVNHMEMLNAYGNIPIANLIRFTARKVVGEPTEPHQIMHSIMVRGTDGELKERHTYVKFPNSRLCHDEMIARIAYLFYKGGEITSCDKKELQQMYDDATLTEDKVTRIGKKVNECLNFMLEVADGRKQLKRGHGLSTNEFTMLYRWYIYFTKKYGPFRMLNSMMFYISLETALNRFIGDDKTKLVSDLYQETARSDPRLIHEAFKGYLGAHNSARKIEKTCEWLTEIGGFDPVKDGSISLVDSMRVFPVKMIEEKLSTQGYRCWVTGKPLTMKEAQGGHIIPHSKGGKTSYDNLIVVHKSHNISMADMNAYDYRDEYRRKQTAMTAE
jgi:hypothetical protein